MATFPMYSYQRPSALTLDTHPHNYFEEDEDSILDENILDQSSLDSALEMSPPLNSSRRDSFAVSSAAGLFSPKTEDWQHADMQPMSSNNPFAEQPHHQRQNSNSNSNNPFMRVESQSSTLGHPSHGWSLANSSGMSTPMQVHDGLPSSFDVDVPIFQRPMPTTPFTNPGKPQLPLFFSSSSGNTSTGSIPTSPQKDWSVSDALEHRGLPPKRMRPHSPTLHSHVDMTRRGDGVRKKNARFDIPAERNLTNIDQLIARSTDEQEIKELKQQKRLLRNRQAALDSRQRKKQHTERLEDEKKQCAAIINELEEEIAEQKITIGELIRKEAQYQQHIDNMQLEKEEMIRHHTIESGDLRKKVSVLTDHIQRHEMTGLSASPPPSTGFASNYIDVDSLTMDGAWDNISFLEDFESEAEVKDEPRSLVPPSPPSLSKKAETALISESEKPAAQGLLLMLLLFGAFVASKGSSPSIPQMSDDVRAASATLLENIFTDAGVAQSASGVSEALAAPRPSAAAMASASSHPHVHPAHPSLPHHHPHQHHHHHHSSNPLPHSWSTAPVSSMGGTEMIGVTRSSLGDLADSLAQPTEEQTNEQLFSLSAAQYNGLTSQDFLNHAPVKSTSPGRRNLGETLAAMRNNQKESAAEVYTRSLLWEQVPSEVVRNFAKMVSECNSQNEKTRECSSAG